MSKPRKTIRMREPVSLDAVLCRDDNGKIAIGIGKRTDLKKNPSGIWVQKDGHTDKWLDMTFNMMDAGPDEFCKWFDVEPTSLPKPGRTMKITIEIPNWIAEYY